MRWVELGRIERLPESGLRSVLFGDGRECRLKAAVQMTDAARDFLFSADPIVVVCCAGNRP
jgi:hypothetical protein